MHCYNYILCGRLLTHYAFLFTNLAYRRWLFRKYNKHEQQQQPQNVNFIYDSLGNLWRQEHCNNLLLSWQSWSLPFQNVMKVYSNILYFTNGNWVWNESAFFGICCSFNGNNNIAMRVIVFIHNSECYCANFYQNEKLISNDELSLVEKLQNKFIYFFFLCGIINLKFFLSYSCAPER